MNFIKNLFGKIANSDDTEKDRAIAFKYWENGQYEECIRICLNIREKVLKRNAKGKHDAFTIPFVNHFIYLGFYYMERWQDAYDFMHDGVFIHRPVDHGQFMSIAMELAYKLGEPAERVIHFGKLCYEARKNEDSIEGMENCAFTACNVLYMMDECGENRFFADILIPLGKEYHNPETLILGYGFLADNYMKNIDPEVGKILNDAKAEVQSLNIPSSHWAEKGKNSFDSFVNYYSKWKPGENSYSEYKFLCNKIQPLLDANNNEKLLDIQKKCLAISENKFGRHHRLTAINCKDIGMCLYRMEKFQEALEYFLKELAAWEADMPAEGPALHIFCLMHIAETYIKLAEYNLSENYYNRILSEYVENIEADNSLFHDYLQKLPDVYCVLGKFDSAVEWLNSFILAKEYEYGTGNHPEVFEQQVRLGNVYNDV